MGRIRLGISGGIICLLAVALFWHGLSSVSARDDEKKEKKPSATQHPDFLVLKKIYGNNEVTIVTDDGKAQFETVRITGVEELFGRVFLRLETRRSNTILTRADKIIAIKIEE